jgi:dipeptidyl aminopeptidase/acylaminoacyl peptidase
VLLLLGAVVAAVAYLGAGLYVYSDLSRIGDGCARGPVASPDSFAVAGVDTTPYLMPRFEDVRFASRDPDITVAAWYVPAQAAAAAPAVVVVHGLGDCRRRPWALLPAGMLHRHGLSVLMIDLRDHGDSTREDGRHAGGTEEYQEVLGAWDWLRSRGHSEREIGLFGESLGGATVVIAAGEEPRVAAVWADSGYAGLGDAVQAELTRNGYPALLWPAGVLAARLVAGDDLSSHAPADAARKLGRRAVFITHGTADTRLSAQYAHDLARAVREGGGAVEPWLVEGAGHIQAVSRHPAAYEERLTTFFTTALAAR